MERISISCERFTNPKYTAKENYPRYIIVIMTDDIPKKYALED